MLTLNEGLTDGLVVPARLSPNTTTVPETWTHDICVLTKCHDQVTPDEKRWKC